MADLDRLLRFLNDAPAGTLVPVDSLRSLLGEAPAAATLDEERRLTAAEAADWLHRHVGGRKRTAAAIRKVMRTGYRGVVLASSLYGRERRTTETDLLRFIAQIGVVPRSVAPDEPVLPTPTPQLPVQRDGDPGDEIAAAQKRFRQRTPIPRPSGGPRRVAGGR